MSQTLFAFLFLFYCYRGYTLRSKYRAASLGTDASLFSRTFITFAFYLPEDTGTFGSLVGQRIVFRLASAGNAAAFPCSVSATWYFSYCDRHSRFDLAGRDEPPIQRAEAGVFPRTCFVCYGRRSI